MEASSISNHINLCAKISNQSSLTPLYRSIELGPKKICVVSEHGAAEIYFGVEGLDRPVLLDAVQLNSVISSLGDKEDVSFELEGTSVKWKAGNARGKWQTVQQELVFPGIDVPGETSVLWIPTPDFPEALRVAASAAMSSAVSVGLYGVLLRTKDGYIHMASSNNIALAYTSVVTDLADGVNITLRPPVPELISHIMERIDVEVAFGSGAIHLMTTEKEEVSMLFYFPTAQELRRDILKVMDAFPDHEQIAAIDPSGLKKFLGRARILSDKRAAVHVGVKVADGKLSLEQRGLSSSSQEEWLADGLDPSINYESIDLPLDLLILPLEHTDAVIFDYVKDKRLIFTGPDYGFLYVLSGRNAK